MIGSRGRTLPLSRGGERGALDFPSAAGLSVLSWAQPRLSVARGPAGQDLAAPAAQHTWLTVTNLPIPHRELSISQQIEKIYTGVVSLSKNNTYSKT